MSDKIYSSVSKNVFARSGNQDVAGIGSGEDLGSPDYIEGDEPIPVAKYKDRNEYLKIEIKPTTVIGFFGPSGSGKTTAINSIASRAYDKGRCLVNLADTDFQFNNYKNNGGVSQSLQDAMGLYDKEAAHEIPAKTLMPKFVYDEMREKKTLDDPPSYVETFSIGFHQMSTSELKDLVNRTLNSKQSARMNMVLDSVEVNQDLSFGKIKDVLEENDDLNEQAKPALMNRLTQLENDNIVSSRQSGNTSKIVDYLNEGYILSIGMGNLDIVLGSSDMWKAEFISSKVAEIVISARLSGDLEKSLLGTIPEAHHLMPAGEGTALASKLKRNFTFYKRRTDFPFLLDSQSPYQLPGRDDDKNILGELNFVFVGREEDGKTLEPKGFLKVLKSMNIVSNVNSSRANDWLERIKDVGHREFLFVKPGMRSPDEAPIVEFLAPLVSNP